MTAPLRLQKEKKSKLSPAQIPVLALKLDDAAVALSISATKLGELATADRIPSVKIDGKRLFPVRAIEEWLTTEANKRLLVERGAEGTD